MTRKKNYKSYSILPPFTSFKKKKESKNHTKKDIQNETDDSTCLFVNVKVVYVRELFIGH